MQGSAFAFALAQPLFDLLSKNPEFFVARHNGALAAFAYYRWSLALQVLSVLVPAPVVFLAIFLLFSGVVEPLLASTSSRLWESTRSRRSPPTRPTCTRRSSPDIS